MINHRDGYIRYDTESFKVMFTTLYVYSVMLCICIIPGLLLSLARGCAKEPKTGIPSLDRNEYPPAINEAVEL